MAKMRVKLLTHHLGHKPGDVVEAAFEYDEEHPDEELRGKSARIIAEIDSFSGRKLPVPPLLAPSV